MKVETINSRKPYNATAWLTLIFFSPEKLCLMGMWMTKTTMILDRTP
jgi:hypothetical protein